MKCLLSILAILLINSANAQISRGSNFFTIGNTAFNKPLNRFETYPDTTISDSGTVTGTNASLMLNYSIAVSNHITIGFKSRFLTNKESTYGISAFGPSARYYFGFGPDTPKEKIVHLKPGDKRPSTPPIHAVHRFYKADSEERLKSFFFVEGSYLFGRMRFDGTSVPYGEAGLQVGAMLRAATPKTQLIRHFGLELGVGAYSVTDPMENRSIIPNVSAGLIVFFDKKYTSHRKIARVVRYVKDEE